MSDSYEEMMGNVRFFLDKKDMGYNMPLTPRLNEVVGNITPGIITAVAGSPSSGKTSFVDSVYVMNVLLQWHFSDNRKPLKIFYFTMKDEKLKKIQQLLCLYLMMVDNIRIDIPTLNSQPGRLFDMNDRPDVIQSIKDAEVFFNDIENEGALQIMEKSKSPSQIMEPVVEYMKEIGDDEDKNEYIIDDAYQEGTVMVVIDSLDYLSPEYDGYGRLAKHELADKVIDYAVVMKERFNINVIAMLSSDVGIVRHPSDTKPLLKHLGPFSKKCDKGIIIYDPIAENALRLTIPNAVEGQYVSKGRNALRFWNVVRNTNGPDFAYERILLLPGSSYMVEFPLENEVTTFNDIYNELMKDRGAYLST